MMALSLNPRCLCLRQCPAQTRRRKKEGQERIGSLDTIRPLPGDNHHDHDHQNQSLNRSSTRLTNYSLLGF